MLRRTIRDHATQRRRAMPRSFACDQELPNELPNAPLTDAIASGGPFFDLSCPALYFSPTDCRHRTGKQARPGRPPHGRFRRRLWMSMTGMITRKTWLLTHGNQGRLWYATC
jgi:hypothetical protein